MRKFTSKIVLSLLPALLLTACATHIKPISEMDNATLKRAAYDLQCSEEKITLTKLQESLPYADRENERYEITYGARGCDKESTYQTRSSEKQVLVYREGAAPDPVIINQSAPQIQTYKPPASDWQPSGLWKPGQPYRPR